MTKRQLLYIEDDPADAELLKEAFRLTGHTEIDFTIIIDGRSAVNLISRRDGYAAKPKPDLILLDLNLPGVCGEEVLSRLRASTEFKNIPVVIFSTSTRKEDIEKTSRLGATGYISKPEDFEGFKQAANKIASFFPPTKRALPKKNKPIL